MAETKPLKITTANSIMLNWREKKDLQQLLHHSKADPYLAASQKVLSIFSYERTVIFANQEMVGFFHPRTYRNQWMAGTPYLSPSYRRRGIMKSVLQSFYDTHSPGIAWVADNNAPGIALYASLGFTREEPKVADSIPGHWYLSNTPGKPITDTFSRHGNL